LSYFSVDMIKLCGTEPNVFEKLIVIAITIKFLFFFFASWNSSFNNMPYSLHPFVFLIKPFCISA
jgi:hypothetical protein